MLHQKFSKISKIKKI